MDRRILGMMMLGSVGLFGVKPAEARMDFNVSGFGSWPFISYTSFGTTTEGTIGYGAALGMEFGGRVVGLEINAQFEVRRWTMSTLGFGFSFAEDILKGVVGPRFHAGDNFSFLTGFFAEYRLNGIESTNFGPVGGIRVEIPTGSARFFFEPRFSYGINTYLGQTFMLGEVHLGCIFGKRSK